LPHCFWTDGTLIDLAAIGRRCREMGAALVVDATQSVGALPLDVAEVQPDFLVVSGYKWLLCPYTIGFLYVAPHRQGGMPLENAWSDRAQTEGGSDWQNGHMHYPEGWQPVPVASTWANLLISWLCRWPLQPSNNCILGQSAK
jgi:selenocysteine lyase/cysteine desulfurase